MLKAKADRQPPTSMSAAPIDGPVAAATPPTAPQVPMAMARRDVGNADRMSVIAAGISNAAPAACTTRAAISIIGSGAAAASAEPRPNRPTPVRNTRRRPRMSARRPPGINNAASTML